MQLKFISLLTAWFLLTFVGITPCKAVNIIPYPQSVEMTDVVFNKAKINKIKYVKAKDMPAVKYILQLCVF